MSAARLGYVVRFVDSLAPALRFYEELIGLPCSRSGEHWAQFDRGGVRLGLYERAAMAAALGIDGERLGRGPGAVEVAFEVADVDGAYRRALARGAEPFAAPGDRVWGERTAYLLDPDGGLVELFARSAAGPRRAPGGGHR